MSATLLHGDCIEHMRGLGENSIDSCVTDPPYHFGSIVKRFAKTGSAAAQHGTDGAFTRAARGFMGKEWDGGDIAFRPETWAEVLRVLKPGGHLLAFGSSKGYHHMAVAIEAAGFEIRDTIMWLYGTGFPKSHDVSKAIDKAGGTSPVDQAQLLRSKREALGLSRDDLAAHVGCTASSIRDWEEGRARAAGAAVEFIVPSEEYRAKLASLLGYSADERLIVGLAVDRRDDGTVYGVGHSGQIRSGGNTDAAAEWEGWGTALKPAFEPVIVARKPLVGTVAANVLAYGTGAININGCRVAGGKDVPASPRRAAQNAAFGDLSQDPGTGSGWDPNVGRFPANVIHDGSDEVEAAFAVFGADKGACAPASGPSLRGENKSVARGTFNGLPEGVEPAFHADSGTASRFFYSAKATKAERAGSKHPTVKPIALMRYLCRLVTPPGGMVLDPFAGTGTTGAAALAEGFNVTLIEREDEYAADIRRRLDLPEPIDAEFAEMFT